MQTITSRHLTKLQENKWQLILCSLYLLCSSLYMASAELSHDEPFSLYHSQLPIKEIIHRFSTDNNPPLYEVLTHVISLVVTPSIFHLRFFSALYICVGIFSISMLAKKLFSQEASIIVITTFIFSNYLLNFSHEIRGYGLFFMFFNLSLYSLLSFLESNDKGTSSRALLFLILSAIGCMYTHYISWIAYGCIAVFILAKIIDGSLAKRKWLMLLGAALLVLLLYLPQLSIFITNSQKVAEGGTWLHAPEWVDLYNIIWKFTNAPVAAVCILLLLFVGGYISKVYKQRNFLSMVFLFVFSLMVVFGISFKIALFHDRYLLFLLPYFHLLIAAVLAQIYAGITQRYQYFLLALILPFAVTWNVKGKESDHLQAAIAASPSEETCYIISPNWYCHNFLYYYKNGYYFRNRYDYDHLPLVGVYFDYNLGSVNYASYTSYRYIHVIASHDANQSSFANFHPTLEALHYKLLRTSNISKTCKGYLYGR